MNELVEIKQSFSDYQTTIKVDKSVKRIEVVFDGISTKVTKLIVDIKDELQREN